MAELEGKRNQNDFSSGQSVYFMMKYRTVHQMPAIGSHQTFNIMPMLQLLPVINRTIPLWWLWRLRWRTAATDVKVQMQRIIWHHQVNPLFLKYVLWRNNFHLTPTLSQQQCNSPDYWMVMEDLKTAEFRIRVIYNAL